jgi:hypothetical protein
VLELLDLYGMVYFCRRHMSARLKDPGIHIRKIRTDERRPIDIAIFICGTHPIFHDVFVKVIKVPLAFVEQRFGSNPDVCLTFSLIRTPGLLVKSFHGHLSPLIFLSFENVQPVHVFVCKASDKITKHSGISLFAWYDSRIVKALDAISLVVKKPSRATNKAKPLLIGWFRRSKAYAMQHCRRHQRTIEESRAR